MSKDKDSQPAGIGYVDGRLQADGVSVEAIAEQTGTPVYIYSAAAIRASYERLRRAFAPLDAKLHYAVKSCPNLHVCRLISELGGGMDVVSGGELERAWLAGAPMEEIVFAGVAKTEAEVRAALDGRFSSLVRHAGRFGREGVHGRGPVGLFNIESESELERIAAISEQLGVPARACIRVNPDVDAKTHEYTTTGLEENKFGIYAERVPAMFEAYDGHPSVELVGVHVHIGSPVPQIDPYVDTVRVILALFDRLEAAGHRPRVLDLGGGWPVDYYHGESPAPEEYAARLVPLLEERVRGGLQVVLEPGRSIMANSGVLITRVQHIKQGRQKRFVMCDAGIQTLIRPAFYRAFHFIWPVAPEPHQLPEAWMERPDLPDLVECDVVGPICETGDFLARGRPLPEVAQNDFLAVFSAGAYGVSMASNYNDHGRPAEVMVDGDVATVVAERQPLASLLETERTTRKLEFSQAASVAR
ncbi:MAG: diaminopimelate decarboxylase [bacterium]|nr:diaminopimelate decarboxylase [bacterium]